MSTGNEPDPRDSITLAESTPLDPRSLIGRFFLELSEDHGEVLDRGIVVGSPSPGDYLLAPADGLGQVVMAISDLRGRWRFFDSEYEATNAEAFIEREAKKATEAGS